MIGNQILGILTDHGIQLYSAGANIASGWTAIQCPFCEDPSAHLVLSNDHGGWLCWRCNRSGTPQFLLKKFGLDFAFIPSDGAREVDLTQFIDDAFGKQSSIRNRVESPDEQVLSIHAPNTIPIMFSPTEKNDIIPEKIFVYLHDRGLRDSDLYHLQVQYTDDGPMRFRAVFPIQYEMNLVNYLGRDITNQSQARYKFCPKDDALIPLESLIWNFDYLQKTEHDILYICEGIFDAISFGWTRATCCFKSFLSPLQVLLLQQIKAKEFRVIFDRGALEQAIDSGKKLSTLCSNVSIWSLDDGADDPGDLIFPEKNIKKVLTI